MSDQAAPEPTMEEILASIRRIISEDDSPAASGAMAADNAEWRPPPAAAEAEPVAGVSVDIEDEVLELTERVPAHVELDTFVQAAATEAEEAHAPATSILRKPVASDARETLIAADAAQKSSSAFGRLADAVIDSAPVQAPSSGRTLEDLAGELLRPMLKAWLDENLPRIVQASVDKEVGRIARGRVG